MCVVYNTAFNTVGVGDPVPYGLNSLGSGDRFDLSVKKPYQKRGSILNMTQGFYKPKKHKNLNNIPKAYTQYKPAKLNKTSNKNNIDMNPKPLLVYKKG